MKPIQQININKTIINYLILLFMTMGVMLSQDNKYESLIERGNTLYQNNPNLSEENYRKAISNSPDSIKGQYNFSNNLYENEYYDEALLNQLDASKNAKFNIDKHQIFHNIGNILMKKKMCKEAVEAYKNALRNEPTDDESRYNLALAIDCAKDQDNEKESEGEDEDENKEKDKDKDDNEDQKDDKDQKGDEDQNDKEDQKENDNKEENKNPNNNPRKTKLSPQQIKNLLEAMNQEENKVQEKINAKKLKGVKLKNEKDW